MKRFNSCSTRVPTTQGVIVQKSATRKKPHEKLPFSSKNGVDFSMHPSCTLHTPLPLQHFFSPLVEWCPGKGSGEAVFEGGLFGKRNAFQKMVATYKIPTSVRNFQSDFNNILKSLKMATGHFGCTQKSTKHAIPTSRPWGEP